MKRFLLLLIFAFGLGYLGWGQVNINAVSTDYTENFNTMTSGTWTDNSAPITGWYARTTLTTTITAYGANTGGTTAGGLYAFGVAGVNPLTDRGLGYAPSNAFTGASGTGKGYIGWRLKNNTGGDISSITVTWTGEQWRKENNATAHTLVLFYQTGTTVTDLIAGTWTAASSTFTSPITGATTATVLDGNAAVNRVANISVTITVSIPAGNEIMLRWEDLNDSGLDHLMAIDDVTVNATSASNVAPTVTTQTPTSVLSTSATGNGTIVATGGVNPTVRGFCWDLASNADPDISDSKVEETGDFTTGAFTGSITGLTAGTQYKARAFATNTINTGYGSVVTFYTQSTEPSNHPASFTASAVSQTQIDLAFSAASTIPASGYLILQKTGSATSGLPTDATAYTVGNTIGDGTVAAIVTNTADITKSITGLTAGTHYYFSIFPYNWDGANASTYNYKTDGSIPVADATTATALDATSEVSGPAIGSQPNPILISSLVTTDVSAIRAFDMDVYDYGGDGQPTKITQLTIKAGTNNTANWTNTLAGIKLSTDAGATFVTIGTPTIAASSIVIPVSIGDLNIPDNDALTLSLYVYLKSSGLTDNQILEFKVDQTASSHGFIADATGSTFIPTFATAPVSNQIIIDVVATILKFVQQPTSTAQNSVMLPSVTIESTDANNNRDLDKTGTVSLVSSGTMTGPVTASLTSGFGTFSSIVHTATGIGHNLTASFDLLVSAISNTFNITSIISSGSILFVGYGTDDPDKFSFVTTTTIPEGTQITFTDNAWTGSALNTNEGSGLYTAPAGGLSAGSYIQISGTTVTGGGTMASNTMAYSTSGDQILAYQGNNTNPSFIAGISSTGWIITGTPNTNSSYLPAPLIQYQTATGFSSEEDNGYYTGPLTLANGAISSFICNGTNWLRSATIQTIPSMSFSFSSSTLINVNATVADITISSGESLTIQSGKNLTITGNLTNNAGLTGLVIKSDASGTGSLLHNSASVNATIERYITGSTSLTANMYHFVSVPLEASNNPQAGLFTGSYLSYFDQPTQSYASASGSGVTTPLDVTRGYMIYYPNTSTTYSFAGTMNNGSFTANTSHYSVFIDPNTYTGFNLVPNPYPSAIDWDAASGWTKTLINDAIWIWNPTAGNYAAYGVDAGVNNGTRYIPQGQSFFVQSSNTSPVLAMNNSVRVHNTQAFYKSAESSLPELLRMKVTCEVGTSDEIVVRFNSMASSEKGLYDVAKLTGSESAPQLYTLTDSNEQLSINALDHSTQTIMVPVGIEYPESNSLTFTASGIESFESSVNIFLEDKLLNKTIDLRENPVYTFTNAAGADPMRFNLLFYGVNSTNELNSANYNIWANNDKINILVPEMMGQKAFVQLIDQQGRILNTQSVTLDSPSVVNAPVSSGLYIVRVVSGNQAFTSKVFIR